MRVESSGANLAEKSPGYGTNRSCERPRRPPWALRSPPGALEFEVDGGKQRRKIRRGLRGFRGGGGNCCR